MATNISTVDSGTWFSIVGEENWSRNNGVASFEGISTTTNFGLTFNGPYDWVEGEGVEIHITTPYDGPIAGFSWANSLGYRLSWFHGGNDGNYFDPSWEWSVADEFAAGRTNVGFKPAYYRIYRDGFTFVLEARETSTSTWARIFQTAAAAEGFENWYLEWVELSGFVDLHYIKGITGASGVRVPIVRLRVSDTEWKQVATPNVPIRLRVNEGGTDQWRTFAGGNSGILKRRNSAGQWVEFMRAGGLYGVVAGQVVSAGTVLAGKPVWISDLDDPSATPIPGYIAVTDSEGRFKFIGLPFGSSYSVSVLVRETPSATWSFNFTPTAEDPLHTPWFANGPAL